MLNKDIFNRVFDKEIDINKVHKDIINKIDKNNRINRYIKYSIVSIFIVSIGILLFNNNKDKVLDNPMINKDNIEIYVNKANNNNILDIDGMAIDMDYNEMSLEYGLVDIKLPEDISINRTYTIYTRDIENNSIEYNILHDFVFIYNNVDNSREIDIAFSRIGMPLRCYRYEENGRVSIINDTELIIYGNDNYYNVIFKYNNYNFDIETRNITLEELIDLLKSIIV